ncbi:MAG TPA: DNA primase [Desulfatiglandales bacterium]|nr:DNA primase [Desulfatiglandales bacterium]
MESYEAAKDEIKRVADIVELIGHYVQLKKAGRNHVGLCPFHGEKDPSFTVSSSKQMFHCFGCKKGGDIFAFWMEYNKVSFPQAMKDLAERYHVTLPEKEFSPLQKEKKELRDLLFEINEIAARYYSHILTKSEKGKPGMEYLEKRSLGKDVIKDFMLGYAPSEWDALTRFLKNKRADMDKAVKAGLIIPNKEGGYYDRFRGRVLFPIHNLKKQVTGFGGRVLDESLPKYLNTPETPIFRKGELLYGLHSAYQTIRESGRVVIVEGYMDVLALRSHGFNGAVATLGTALTRDHIRKVKGYAVEAIVVFDSDSAGKAATIKSFPLFLNEGFTARVMVLPEGDDPDSFINKRGLEAFLKFLDESMPIFEFYIDLKISRINKGIEGQVNLLKEILPILADVDSDPQRSLYARRLSEKSGIAESIVFSELRNRRATRHEEGNEDGLRERLSNLKMEMSPERDLLNLMIHYPSSVDRFIDSEYQILLSNPDIIEIFHCMDEIYRKEGCIKSAEISEKLEHESARETFREIMLSAPICPDDSLEQAINEFKNKILKTKISRSLRSTIGDLEGSSQLLNILKDSQN